MILTDGPLDGEEELVEMVPTAPGSRMFFNVPTFQFFDTEGNFVSQGLTATYEFVGPGPDPDPDEGDTWDSAWIFTYVGEAYTPPYPPGAMYPDLDFIDPGEGPHGESTTVAAQGDGFNVVTAVYMPLSPNGEDTDNPCPSFNVTDDNDMTFQTFAAPAAGLYDLCMAYTDQTGYSAFNRWTGVFTFQ
jgi:hypothetical protein